MQQLIKSGVMFVGALVFASMLRAETEYAGGQAIVGTGDPLTTFYAPTTELSLDASEVFMYVQGDFDLSTTPLDQVLFFKHPNNPAGVTSPYDFVKRILPDGSPERPDNEHYGAPSIVRYGSTYYMTAHQSPDASTFHRQWWGWSSDGYNWTWRKLLQYTGSLNLDIPGISVVPRTVGSATYFYGFIDVQAPYGLGLGAIRIRTALTPHGYDLVELYTDAGWQAVNADGTFGDDKLPKLLGNGYMQPKYRDGHVWYSVASMPKVNCGSCTFSGQQGFADRFAHSIITVPASASEPPSIGPMIPISSQIRCFPAPYENSRHYPDRFFWWTDLIYSASNDANNVASCSPAGGQFPGMYIVATHLLPTYKAKADFNADSNNDIVLRNYANGSNAVWLMNGTSLLSIADLPGLTDTNWRIEGTADFSGDGTTDILLRNSVTGQNALWLMSGTTLISIVDLPALANTDYHFEGSSDFNADGKPDIILRNYVSGVNAVWMMDGVGYNSTVDLPALPNTDWKIESAADFNADGKNDIVLRNYVTGQNALWIMNGTTLSSIIDLPVLTNTSYRFDAVGDFSADGRPDIVLRNYTTGANAIWVMDGTTFAGVVDLPALANVQYEINGPR